MFVDASGKETRFQTTVRAVGGHYETAQRYARLCYAKFEEGWTKEQVQEFRANLYRSVEAGASGPQPSQNEGLVKADAATEKTKKSKQAMRRELVGNEQVKADREETPRKEKKSKKEKKTKESGWQKRENVREGKG